MKKIKGYFIAVLTILYALALLVYSRDVSQGIISSLKTCLNVIIPSLFPFMVVSGIIISSGLYAKLGKPFSSEDILSAQSSSHLCTMKIG